MLRFSWMVTVIIMLFSTISPLTEGKSPRVNSFLAMLVCHCGWCGWDFCHPPKSPRDERCVIWATGFACQSTLSFSFPPTEDSISPLKPSLLITMQNDQRQVCFIHESLLGYRQKISFPRWERQEDLASTILPFNPRAIQREFFHHGNNFFCCLCGTYKKFNSPDIQLILPCFFSLGPKEQLFIIVGNN